MLCQNRLKHNVFIHHPWESKHAKFVDIGYYIKYSASSKERTSTANFKTSKFKINTDHRQIILLVSHRIASFIGFGTSRSLKSFDSTSRPFTK